jgi:FixJ family two-component response regulator
MSQNIGPPRGGGPTAAIGCPEKPICIVDDDAVVCDSLSALLEAHGFKALAHASSAAFLADERRGRLGCLIIDQHMPGTDGLGVLGTLRDENIAVPSILITGRLDASIAERAAKFAVTAILEKPFPTGRLIELVRAALDRST